MASCGVTNPEYISYKPDTFALKEDCPAGVEAYGKNLTAMTTRCLTCHVEKGANAAQLTLAKDQNAPNRLALWAKVEAKGGTAEKFYSFIAAHGGKSAVQDADQASLKAWLDAEFAGCKK